MAKKNARAAAGPVTREGAPALPAAPIDALRRTVLACLLWEDGFYESGESIADRIRTLVPQCNPQDVADLAVKARDEMRLRHAPLLLVRELARHPSRFSVAKLLKRVIQRADELGEFLAIYWDKRDGTRRAPGQHPVAKQVKKGLAWALEKFDEYQLRKYRGEGKQVSLADVICVTRPKPRDEAQAALWKRVLDGKLYPARTHEERLSAGEDPKEVFESMLKEGKLGHMALLRNLRKMSEVGVSEALVIGRLMAGAAKSKALPFRYVAAARAAPRWVKQIDAAMQVSLANLPKLPGSTVVLVDVSGSMDSQVSGKSDLTRIDAAGALAVLLAGVCENVRVFTFSDRLVEVPAYSGLALLDGIVRSQSHGGTQMGAAVRGVQAAVKYDRLVVFTDEQSGDEVGSPWMANGTRSLGYMINVATAEHGVGFEPWVRINGFSEAIVRYIAELEGVPSAATVEEDAESA